MYIYIYIRFWYAHIFPGEIPNVGEWNPHPYAMAPSSRDAPVAPLAPLAPGRALSAKVFRRRSFFLARAAYLVGLVGWELPCHEDMGIERFKGATSFISFMGTSWEDVGYRVDIVIHSTL